MMANQICPVELLEIIMNQDDESAGAPSSIEEVAIRGMTLTEALYEILADKGVLTGERVIERIKKLKSEIKTNLSRPN
jgi:hypothetical protein